MKSIVGLMSLIAVSSMAGEVPPVYLKNLRVTVVASVLSRASLVLQPGVPEHCVRKELKDLIYFDCAVTATSEVVSREGTQNYRFNKVRIEYLSLTTGDVMRRFYFQGTVSDEGAYALKTRVILNIRSLRSNPDGIYGSLEFPDLLPLGVSAPIQGGPVQ